MDSVEILPGYRAVGLTLHVPGHKVLAFADTHLGYEEELNKKGVLVPHFQYEKVVEHVREALEATQPETVIINGDLKHEFGRISQQEWREVMRFLDLLSGYDVKVVKGNHDTIVGPIAEKGNVELVGEARYGTTLFAHGHEEPRDLKGAKTVVIGHEHPAIGLREEGRVETVKCFLVGRWKRRDLIVLPSMNRITEGTDVLKEQLLSPLLRKDLGAFRAYASEGGRIMDFGQLKDIPS